jgi:hypothetical protein
MPSSSIPNPATRNWINKSKSSREYQIGRHFVLSAIAPETIVAAVAANTV